MTQVKGSKQFRMVVVPYRPLRKALLFVVGLVLVILACSGSYYWGQWRTGAELLELRNQRDQLQSSVAQLDSAHTEALQQLANLRLGAKVDQQANEGVRQEVLALKSQIAELEEDISFYRGLMAPTADKKGLSFGSVNLVATNQARRYSYTIVVQQLAANHELLNGYLNVTAVGYEAGVSKRLPLKALAAGVTSENIKLRFKYFQTLSGELTLPQGFEPERLELVAVTTGKKAARIEQVYGWLVQEPKRQTISGEAGEL